MSNKPLSISDEAKVQMPMKTVASLIALVAIGTWAFFGIQEKLNTHATKLQIMEKDLEMNSEFRIKWPRGLLGSLPRGFRAIYADRDGISKSGVMNAFAGDTHIMYADWNTEGVLDLKSIDQYGSATVDESSEHYDDQVEMFTKGEYKNMPMYLEDVIKVKTRDYIPGKRQYLGE